MEGVSTLQWSGHHPSHASGITDTLNHNNDRQRMAILRHSRNKTCPRRPHRRDGRPHVTPVCFILDGDELAFALSLGASKAQAWPTIGASHSASAMSGNPTASSPSKEKRWSPPGQTRSHTSPTATTPLSPQRTSLHHSYRQASPQFGSASPTSSHDPASADTPTPEGVENDGRLRQESSNTRTGEMK